MATGSMHTCLSQTDLIAFVIIYQKILQFLLAHILLSTTEFIQEKHPCGFVIFYTKDLKD